MKEILCVAAGGALGAVGRYLLSSALARALPTPFPLGTLAVNVLGSLALGLLMGAAARGGLSPEWRLFVGVGVLGALTTFSTFSVETVALFREGRGGLALLNVLGSVVLCVSVAALGVWWMQRGR